MDQSNGDCHHRNSYLAFNWGDPGRINNPFIAGFASDHRDQSTPSGKNRNYLVPAGNCSQHMRMFVKESALLEWVGAVVLLIFAIIFFNFY
jgi:hypothetical protein